MTDSSISFDSVVSLVSKMPDSIDTSRISAFIDVIKDAKYSTFLTPEREQEYEALNVVPILNQIKYFDMSCKSSVLLIPGLRKYINLLKPQPTKVDAYF